MQLRLGVWEVRAARCGSVGTPRSSRLARMTVRAGQDAVMSCLDRRWVVWSRDGLRRPGGEEEWRRGVLEIGICTTLWQVNRRYRARRWSEEHEEGNSRGKGGRETEMLCRGKKRERIRAAAVWGDIQKAMKHIAADRPRVGPLRSKLQVNGCGCEHGIH